MMSRQASTSRARLFLDRLSVKATAAYSMQRKLRAGYRGAAFRVRRSSDNAEMDIGFLGRNVNTAALLTFCAATSGFLVYWYDQSGNGNDIFRLSSSPTEQPRVVNAGALEVNSNSKFACYMDGTNDSVGRGDAFGLSGSPALTVGWAEQAYDSDYTWVFGAVSGTNNIFSSYIDLGATQVEASQGGSARAFDWSPTSGSQYFIVGKAASATPSAFTCEANGVALTQENLVNGASAMSIGNTNTHIGTNRGISWHVAHYAAWMVFNSALAGNDLTSFRTELAAHA